MALITRHVIHYEVRLDGSLMWAETLDGKRSLRLGNSAGCHVVSSHLGSAIALLAPASRGGFQVQLQAPLSGLIRYGSRVLRVQHGLLADPRPEPLLLGEGDGGELNLGRKIQLQFSILAKKRVLPLPRPDRRLVASMGLATAVIGLLALAVGWGHKPGTRSKEGVKLLAFRSALMIDQQAAQHEQRRRRARLERKKTTSAKRRPSATHARRAQTARSDQRSSRPRERRPALAHSATQRENRKPETANRRLLSDASTPRLDRMMDALAGASKAAAGRGPRERSPAAAAERARKRVAPLASRDGLALAAVNLPALPSKRLDLKSGRPSTTHPSRKAIHQVVSRYRGAVQVCYERELLASRKAKQGTLLLRWGIDRGGVPQRMQVMKDGLGSAALRRCVLSRLRQMRFPPCADERCVVVFPFEFFPHA
jgi:hypothetical protein